MPMFYFHVRQDNIRFEDPVGIELPDLDAARQRRSLNSDIIPEMRADG